MTERDSSSLARPLLLDDTVIEKHSVSIAGHRTSLSLERGFWRHIKRLAAEEGKSLAGLVRELDEARSGSLSGAIRCYVLQALEADVD